MQRLGNHIRTSQKTIYLDTYFDCASHYSRRPSIWSACGPIIEEGRVMGTEGESAENTDRPCKDVEPGTVM